MKSKYSIKILALSLFVCFATALSSELLLRKTTPTALPNQSITRQKLIQKYMKYKGNVIIDDRKIRATTIQNQADTIKVLALRVEFMEDSTPLTTGNGKMDLAGFLTPADGLFYDPPHTRRYFINQLQGMQNYYKLNSLGKLYIKYDVLPYRVVNCYQLPHQMSYYSDTTSIEGIETGLCRLMFDAIRVADRDPDITFSDFDKIIIFHAGSSAQTDLMGNSPFDLLAGTIGSNALEAYLGQPYILADEGQARISAATIMPEMMRQDTLYQGQTNILGMFGLAGTLYHEFCHLIGGFDEYDVTGYSIGVGAWSLMGTGGWLGDWGVGAPPGSIPGMLDAFHKVHFGWVEPLVIQVLKESIPLFVATMDTNRMRNHRDTISPIIIKIPISATEYFLIENRKTDFRKKDTIVVDAEDGVTIWVEDGEYDFFLPGSGVLIWHIDDQVIAEYGPYNAINIFPEHKGVDLEEGDGIQDFDGFSSISQWDYQYYGSPNDPFYIGGFNSEFSDLTTPNSDGYFGKTHIKISTITVPDTTMQININFGLTHAGFPKNPERGLKFVSSHVADLDLDGQKEIITSDSGGRIYVWRDDGSSYLPNTQGSFAQLSLSIVSAPAIGDVTGDDKLEVVCATENGMVLVFPYSGLQPIAVMFTDDRILSSPVLADLDNDGKKEIIIGSADMNLYIWRGDGTSYTGSPIFLNSEIRSSVAITDTAHPQIVVLGSDNRLFLINPSDAVVVNKFPITLSNSALFTSVPPVVGDVDNDGNKEIIAIVHSEVNYQLFVIDLLGNIKYSSPAIIESPVNSAPALADIDNDGFLEIIFSGKNKIYAFNFNGTLQTNYPFTQDSTYTSTLVLGGYLFTVDVPFIFNSSPIISDINNDGISDIIIGSPRYGLLGFDGKNGRALDYFPLATVGSVSASPLISDLDNDGYLEICVGSDAGVLYVWDLPVSIQTEIWSQYLQNPCHTGLYLGTPEMPSPPTTIVKNFYTYPNPAENEVTIRYWLGMNPQKVKINLLDIAGHPKFEFDGSCYPLTDNEVKVSLNGIPSGIYLLRLEVNANQKKEIKFYKFAIVK